MLQEVQTERLNDVGTNKPGEKVIFKVSKHVNALISNVGNGTMEKVEREKLEEIFTILKRRKKLGKIPSIVGASSISSIDDQVWINANEIKDHLGNTDDIFGYSFYSQNKAGEKQIVGGIYKIDSKIVIYIHRAVWHNPLQARKFFKVLEEKYNLLKSKKKKAKK